MSPYKTYKGGEKMKSYLLYVDGYKVGIVELTKSEVIELLKDSEIQIKEI